MGFSTSAATAIIFTGVIILLGVTSNTIFTMYQDLSEAALDVSDTEYDRQRTRVSILNSTYNSTTVFINVTNTGEVTIDTAYLDVLFNGTIETEGIQIREVGGTISSVWGVHEVLYLEVDFTSANDRTRIRLITPNGVSGTKIMA